MTITIYFTDGTWQTFAGMRACDLTARGGDMITDWGGYHALSGMGTIRGWTVGAQAQQAQETQDPVVPTVRTYDQYSTDPARAYADGASVAPNRIVDCVSCSMPMVLTPVVVGTICGLCRRYAGQRQQEG